MDRIPQSKILQALGQETSSVAVKKCRFCEMLFLKVVSRTHCRCVQLCIVLYVQLCIVYVHSLLACIHTEAVLRTHVFTVLSSHGVGDSLHSSLPFVVLHGFVE